MLSVTKIFRFEMGHAINEYDGMCKFIHGHSYVLQVTVTTREPLHSPLIAPGFVIDFKILKKTVKENVVAHLDHSLMLSENYIRKHPEAGKGQNLIVLAYEPSAENILYYIREEINKTLPEAYKIVRLKLWETSESFAEWEADR